MRLMPDGSGVVGVYGDKVFRWTPREGYSDVGIVPTPEGASVWVRPHAISADGATVVGRVARGMTDKVFRWTVNDGLQFIGVEPSPAELHLRTMVSDDGAVVVGNYRSESDIRTFAWSQQSGLNFPELPSLVTALSGDGTAVSGGTGWPPTSYVWTAAAGTKVINPPPGEYQISTAGISLDGGVVVGGIDSYSSQPRAYRWSEALGVEKLGDLGSASSALAVSADGSVVVGWYSDIGAIAERIFYWNETDGMRPLHEVLSALQIDMTPAFINPNADRVLDVSDDGSVILGMSVRIDADGPSPLAYRYWVADLSAVPEPQTWALVAAVAAQIYLLRRSKRS